MQRIEASQPHAEKATGVTVVVAEMTVAYKMIRQTFTSRVTLDRPNLKIMVEYLDGPFSRLQNRWTFHPTGESSCTRRVLIDMNSKAARWPC